MAHPVFSGSAAPCDMCPRRQDDLHFRSHVDEVATYVLSRRISAPPADLPARRLKEVQLVGSEWAHLENHELNHDPPCADECVAASASDNHGHALLVSYEGAIMPE